MMSGAGSAASNAGAPTTATTSASSGFKSNLDGKIAGMYDLKETLGRGHFAIVKLARHVFTGQKVAVKVIDKGKLDDISRAHLFQEVRCMKLVQHPNVVRLYEVIDTQTKLYLILELGDGGDMYDYIMQHESGLSQALARNYFFQIVSAISYCHKLHVVHRDLKPENVIFFRRQGVVKLTDFGFSNLYMPGEKLETSCGSLAYSAPEILLGDSYDAPAVDVWSLGVLLYMLVCGEPPFNETNDSETLTMIMDCKYYLPDHISEDCKNLISNMLQRDPEKRLTLEQIFNSPWLREEAANSQPVEPLITRHDISESVHDSIVETMVRGNIADRGTIMKSLESDNYDHITATYFLLAERKLKKQVGELAPEDNSLRRHSVQPQLASLALSPRATPPDHPSLDKPINNNISHLCSPVAPQPSSKPIAIPAPPASATPSPAAGGVPTSASPMARSTSEEEVSCSPRRHRMEREHLTIHPRHGRNIVKEGLQSLDEEEFQHIADEELDSAQEPLISSSDGAWGKSRRAQGGAARPNNQTARLNNTTVLNQITEEEDEQESDEERTGGMDQLLITRQLRHRKTVPAKDTPHQIKSSAKVPSRGGYSSSDASDDDTDPRRRSEKFDTPSKGQRRGSKDGPPNGGGSSSSGAGSNNNTGPEGGGNNGPSRNGGANSSSGSTGGEGSNSGGGGSNAYERKKSNELRESLKQSNLSMNSSNSSSSYSISKFAIDPNNTTPSDSDETAANGNDLAKAWSRKDNNLSCSDSNLYIIPREQPLLPPPPISPSDKSNLQNGSPAKKQLKRDSSTLSGTATGKTEPDLNSRTAAANKPGKAKNKEIRKKRNRIGSMDTSEAPLKPGGKSDSSCCRLV